MKRSVIQLLAMTVGSLVALAAETPSLSLPAAKLLNRYKKALDAAQSMIESYEEVDEADYRLFDGPGAPKGIRFARGQHRLDGERLYSRNYYWGDVNSGLRSVPENNPRYNLWIEADGLVYNHTTAPNDPHGGCGWRRKPIGITRSAVKTRTIPLRTSRSRSPNTFAIPTTRSSGPSSRSSSGRAPWCT